MRFCRPAALGCVVVLPVALLYARALAEILVGIIDALFLVQVWASRGWGVWRRFGARRGFAAAAAAWWGWQVVCSAVGSGGVVLSLVLVRLPLFAVALGWWVLAGARARARRVVWRVVAGAVVWIVVECWQQYLTGRNVFGVGRWEDGALTGPFARPRAGPELILTLFAVLVPVAAGLLASRRGVVRVGGAAVVVVGAATVVLIGQRMPAALLGLGLGLSGVLLPRLRVATVAAGLVGAAVVAMTPVVAPATYAKLVVQTRDQVGHFAASSYGLIWGHALAIARAHPWMGLGFDAFRRVCAGVPRAEGDACNIHPHNYYLEAADNGGVAGVVLFAAMAVAGGVALARGRRDALRTGLLVGWVVALWPLASTSAFTAMPNAGWVFLLLGLGLSERAGGTEPVPPNPPSTIIGNVAA